MSTTAMLASPVAVGSGSTSTMIWLIVIGVLIFAFRAVVIVTVSICALVAGLVGGLAAGFRALGFVVVALTTVILIALVGLDSTPTTGGVGFVAPHEWYDTGPPA